MRPLLVLAVNSPIGSRGCSALMNTASSSDRLAASGSTRAVSALIASSSFAAAAAGRRPDFATLRTCYRSRVDAAPPRRSPRPRRKPPGLPDEAREGLPAPLPSASTPGPPSGLPSPFLPPGSGLLACASSSCCCSAGSGGQVSSAALMSSWLMAVPHTGRARLQLQPGEHLFRHDDLRLEGCDHRLRVRGGHARLAPRYQASDEATLARPKRRLPRRGPRRAV